MTSINSLYKLVIEDVIKNIKAEFENEDIDMNYLHYIQKTWEEKLSQTGVLNQHDDHQNAMWDQYARFQSIPQNRYPYDNRQMMSGYPPMAMNKPNLPNIYSNINNNNNNANSNINMNPNLKVEAQYNPQVNMSINSILNPNSGSIANTKPVQNIQVKNDNNNNNNIPQYDGSYTTDESSHIETNAEHPDSCTLPTIINGVDVVIIPQLDGNDDDDDDNNFDDLSSDSDTEPETTNIVLCQYEKVNRNKGKYKCLLKDGIMSIQGKDYHFSRANGEFDF